MTTSYSFPKPENGSVTQVSQDILWVRMPLPFRLNHVNLWLVRGTRDWMIIDTGVNSDEIHNIWERVLSQHKPERIIATHYHPDHIGNAGYLMRHYDIPFHAPYSDWAFGRMLSLIPEEAQSPTLLRYYTQFGLEGERLQQVLDYGNHYARNVSPLPDFLHRIRNGDEIVGWKAMMFGGHTAEHLCLYNAEQKTLIAGDQILPNITPNISVTFFEPLDNPLTAYLASLEVLKTLPADTLVLPSHGLPFVGLHERIAAIQAHHADRLAFVLERCTTPQTAAMLMDALFPQQLDRHQIMFAIGEAAAHANHLVEQGKLKRHEGAVMQYVRV